MKRLAIGLSLLLVLLLAVAAWVGEVSVRGEQRERVEALLAHALGTSVHFDTLTLSLWPASLEVEGLSLGDDGTNAIKRLTIRLFPLSSLREGRPVVVLKIDAPMVDLTQLPDHPEEDVGTIPWPEIVAMIPPLRVSELTIRDLHLRFRMGGDAVDLTADSLHGVLQRAVLLRRIETNLEMRNAAWRRRQFGFRIDTMMIGGGADADGVWMERASIDGPDLTLRLGSTNTTHREEGTASFKAAALGAFVDELALLGGEAKLEGVLSGDAFDPIVDTKLTWIGASLAGRAIGDVTTRFTRKRSRLAFEDLRVSGEVGSAAGAAELVVYHAVPIQADLVWEKVDLQKLLDLIGTEVPFADLIEGRTVLSGTLDPLDLRITGAGSTRSPGANTSPRTAAWNASTRVRAELFEGHAQIEQAGNQVTADLAIDSNLVGHLTASVADLGALTLLLPEPVPHLGLTGTGHLTADLGGTVDAPTLHADVELADAAVSGTAVKELNGSISIAHRQLKTPNLHFATGGGEGALSGTLALDGRTDNQWDLSLRDVDTNLVVGVASKLIGFDVPIADGAVSASVACSGPWPAARVESEVRARGLRIYGERFDAAHVKVTAPLPAWEGNAELQHSTRATITAKATAKSLDSVDLSFATDPLRLADIEWLAQPDLRGSVSFNGRLSGRWRELGGRIEVSGKGLAQPRRELGNVEVVANGQQGRWDAHADALQGQLAIDATLRSAAPFAYTLAAHAREANLSPLLGPGASQLTITGELSLAGELADVAHPSGTLCISDFRLQRDVHVAEEIAPFVFDLTRGRMVIRSLGIRYEDSRIDVSGEASTAGDLRLEARGQGDLVLLELFDLPIAAARGPFSIRAAVSYAPGVGWNLDGEGRTQDAVVDLGLPVAFTRTSAAIVLRDNQIRLQQIEGRAGGGQFQLAGVLDLEHGPAVDWKVREVGFGAIEGLEVKATGDGTFSGTWQRPRITGSVEVLNALYDRNFDWGDVLPWLLEQLSGRGLPKVRTIEQPIGLNLIIYSRGGVFVDNNLANLETWLDLQILGDTSAPVISGRIGFLDGEVFLRGRKFTIAGGTVDFRDYYRNNPILNISAEGRVVSSDSDYGLTMVVTGTASNPRIQFSASDPTLSQTDVFSLATFGKTTAQLQREGSGVSAVDALALLPTGGVEKTVGQLVGFDRFEVEAQQSRSSGAIEPRVTIGKDITEQLRALAWNSFGVESRRAVQLEYRVTRRVSLLGAWESDTRSEAGAFGGDIKFRYEFRRMPFSLLGEVFPSLF